MSWFDRLVKLDQGAASTRSDFFYDQIARAMVFDNEIIGDRDARVHAAKMVFLLRQICIWRRALSCGARCGRGDHYGGFIRRGGQVRALSLGRSKKRNDQ